MTTAGSPAFAGFVGKADRELADAWRADVRRTVAEGSWFSSFTRVAPVVHGRG